MVNKTSPIIEMQEMVYLRYFSRKYFLQAFIQHSYTGKEMCLLLSLADTFPRNAAVLIIHTHNNKCPCWLCKNKIWISINWKHREMFLSSSISFSCLRQFKTAKKVHLNFKVGRSVFFCWISLHRSSSLSVSLWKCRSPSLAFVQLLFT